MIIIITLNAPSLNPAYEKPANNNNKLIKPLNRFEASLKNVKKALVKQRLKESLKLI